MLVRVQSRAPFKNKTRIRKGPFFIFKPSVSELNLSAFYADDWPMEGPGGIVHDPKGDEAGSVIVHSSPVPGTIFESKK